MKTTEGSRRVRRLAALTRHADAPALPGSKGQATLELIEARFGCGARHDATRRILPSPRAGFADLLDQAPR